MAMRGVIAVVARFLPRFAVRRSALGLDQFICLVPFSITVEVWQNAVCSAVLRVHVLSPDSSRSPDWLRIGVSPTQPSPCAVSPMSRCLIRGTVAAFRRTGRTDGMMYRIGP